MKSLVLWIIFYVSPAMAVNNNMVELEYSEALISMHSNYNSSELEELKALIETYLVLECPAVSGKYSIEYINGSVDLFVSWDEWKVVDSNNKSILDIDVTLWQAPGSFKLESLSNLSCKSL